MFRKTKKIVALAMAALLTVHTAPELAVNAAVTGWELVEREKPPLDKICFDTEDKLTGEKYLIGYKDKKVTIVDMDGKIVAKTKYTWVDTTSVLMGGSTVLVVKKDEKAGLADLNGNEVLACSYEDIWILDSHDEHTLIQYEKTDGSQFVKVDDKYVLKNISNASFKMYNNELVIVATRAVEESIYDIYDLTGNKKETMTWEQWYNADFMDDDEEEFTEDTDDDEDEFIDVTDDNEDEFIEGGDLKGYCNKSEGKENYEKAKEEWLLAKEAKLRAGSLAYFSYFARDPNAPFAPYISITKENVFTAYQCINGKMYYYIAAQLCITKVFPIMSSYDYLTTVNYLQIYDEDQNLISEGQANLEKSNFTKTTDEAVPFIVYVLDKEGNLLKFDAEKSCMEKLFTWKKEALFCSRNAYSDKTVDTYKMPVYMYDENYKITEQQGKNPDLCVTYRTSAFVSVEEKKFYIPADKSIEEYDVYMRSYNLYFRSTADNETDVYYASTKFEKLSTLKESIHTFESKDSWCNPSFFSNWTELSNKNMYCLINQTKGTIYFIGKNLGLIENCKDNLLTDLKTVSIFRYMEKLAFTFYAEPVTYDELGNKTFMKDEATCRIAFLDSKKQTISWKNIPLEAYKTINNSTCYSKNDDIVYGISGQKVYYMDLIKAEYNEIDLTNALAQQKGTIEGLTKAGDELYIQYSILDGKRKYYGYVTPDGRIIYDAAVIKKEGSTEKIQKIENYFLYGNTLLDKDFNMVSRDILYDQLVAYDDRKYDSDFYLFYSFDDSKNVGFVYDKNTDKVIFDFTDTGKQYHDVKILGDYIILNEEDDYEDDDTYNSLCVNKTTGEAEKEFAHHYEVMDTKNKRYYAFKLNVEQKADKNETGNTVQKGKSYTVGKQTYKVTNTITKTVTFTKTSNTKTSETIPSTVKIKGSTYKVTAIGDNVYKDNKKIKKVVIGSNIMTIGKNVWKNCKNLTTIQIKTKVLTKIGSSAIKGTSKKLKITVPSGKKKAYKKLWKGKGNDKAKI